jgi:two-component system, sensor histidine kinase PdtaS
MGRSSPRFLCLIIAFAGLFVCRVGIAQETVRLPVRQKDFLHAKAIEQQARKQLDSLMLAEAWYQYGKTYVMAGDFHSAQRYFLQALRIQEAHGDSPELSRLYYRLSENERCFNHFSEALRYAKRCLQVAQRIKSDKALIRAYGELGKVYQSNWNGQRVGHEAEFNRILDCYKIHERLCYKIQDTLGIAEANMFMGELFTQIKDLRAIPHLEKGLYIFTLKNKKGLQANAMLRLASACLNAGKIKQTGYLLHHAKALNDSLALNEYLIASEIENMFVAYCERIGNTKAALIHLRKFNALQTNRLIADRDGAVSRLNIEYETEKKQSLLNTQKRELALRAENLQNQQRFTVGTSALFILAMGMSLVFFRLYRKNQRISRQNAELVREQNHRVKNNLQVVSSLLSLQSKRLTDDAAKKAIEESRLRIESMAILHRRLYDGEKLAQVNVADFVQELAQGVLKSYGYADVKTRFKIEPIFLSADKAVPLGLIINELITNTCKYAIPDNLNPELQIVGFRNHNQITITVADNGPGSLTPGWPNTQTDEFGWSINQSDGTSANEVKAKKSSFGMQLLRAQIEQLNGTYQFLPNGNNGSTGVTFTLTFAV